MAGSRLDYPFSRNYRLTDTGEFRRVYRNAWRGRAGPFTWYARGNACQHPRLGMAVPKRVVKRATDRSRVKRLIRESFRHNQNKLPAVDVVVAVKALPRDFHDPALHRTIGNIWEDLLSSAGNAS